MYMCLSLMNSVMGDNCLGGGKGNPDNYGRGR